MINSRTQVDGKLVIFAHRFERTLRRKKHAQDARSSVLDLQRHRTSSERKMPERQVERVRPVWVKHTQPLVGRDGLVSSRVLLLRSMSPLSVELTCFDLVVIVSDPERCHPRYISVPAHVIGSETL